MQTGFAMLRRAPAIMARTSMFRRAVIHALSFLLIGVAATAVAQAPAPDSVPQIGQVSKNSVWVPTPERMIRRLLQIADTTRDDLVMDLGSGDGRVPIYAAHHFGTRAIGVELEANLVRLSLEAARAQGVAHLVQFVRQDLFETDLSRADVITLYLSPGAMTLLKPRLMALKPGVRVVSHQFTLEDWEADETIRVEGRTGYLWVVPAPVRGSWRLSIAGDELRLRIEQKFQELSTKASRAGRPVNVVGARLRGSELSFTSFDRDGNSRHYRGRVDGARMQGLATGEGGANVRWTAVRD